MFLNKTAIMGIINLTPDSFYDGGKFINKKNLLNQIKKINSSDIIDFGCESSRPNSTPISEKEEIWHNYMIKNIDAKNTWYVLNKLL